MTILQAAQVQARQITLQLVVRQINRLQSSAQSTDMVMMPQAQQAVKTDLHVKAFFG